jgi:cation diffusion facilitator family transporter
VAAPARAAWGVGALGCAAPDPVLARTVPQPNDVRPERRLDRDVRGAAGGSTLTVAVALAVNLLIAGAKSVAAALTGSASMLAEAAHSWADAGNEVLLLVADRRSRRPADEVRPFGYGREAYFWSMLAAVGLFVAGAVVSVTHGVQELIHPEPATDFGVGYLVLGIAFLLESVSFVQSLRQARPEAAAMDRDLLEHVLATSDPTLRAVFAEDAAALVGLLFAATGLGLHQVTGSAVPDALGSIAVGLLLAVVALILIERNRSLLVGELADPELHAAALRRLLAQPEVDRVTKLRLEVVGPRQVVLVAAVDLVGDDAEAQVAARLCGLESRLMESPVIAGVLLGLSAPDDASLPLRAAPG